MPTAGLFCPCLRRDSNADDVIGRDTLILSVPETIVNRRCHALVLFVGFILLAFSSAAQSGPKKQTATDKKLPTGAAAQKAGGAISQNTPAETAAKQAALTSKLTSSILDQQPELSGDYIPCKFTFAELRSLQAPEIALTLSSADAEKLKQSVIGAVISETPNLKSSGENLNKFIENIGKEPLIGLTPSQALNRIVSLLQDFNQKEAKAIQPATQDDVNEIISVISPVISQDHASITQLYAQE
ncbi:MAG: hypothetical protein ACXV8X_08185, partial [Candidatus Angelobacter sp.]